jgi:hypothetical protein
MIVYSHNYITLRDVCKHNSLDIGEVMEAIGNSNVCFGANEDTLISRSQLQIILDNFFDYDIELDWRGLDDTVLVSLGS